MKFSPLSQLLIALIALHSAVLHAEWFSDKQSIMGTAISVTLWHEDAAVARQAIAAVMNEMRRIDNTFSPYIESSELSRVNREAAKGSMAISEELASIIDKALYYSRISDGAFDISFASVGKFYDYRNQQKPSEQARQALLVAIDYRLIELNKAARQLHFKHPDLQIDLGGIAKGYAVDRAAQILQGFGVLHATVSAGGDSQIIGDKFGQPWIIGIKNPRGPVDVDGTPLEKSAILLPLNDTAISTSGDYERFFIDAASGERVHHILNPKTGASASGVASVSVLGPRGFDTDPLSTTVFVLGVEKGLALINRLRGFDCVIIDAAGNVHYSDGLAPPVNSAAETADKRARIEGE